MRLIKQTQLLCQVGTSDKVYEVDLCNTSEQLYVVNFRYGRRGSNLKEGSKTEQPVSLAEAEKIFDKLVNSKLKGGYQDVTSVSTTEEKSPLSSVTDNPRYQAIINHLAGAGNNRWTLERAIWRAGELKIKEATPWLIQLIGTGEALRDYCLAWALGWCGDASTISEVTNLSNNTAVPEFVKRIAWEATIKLADQTTQKQLRSQKINQLPPQLQTLAINGSSEAFLTELRAYLEQSNYRNFEVLDIIYQIDNEIVRPALINILQTAPFQPNYFKQIRHIFKIAEYRRDAEVVAIFAYRLEKEKAMYQSNSYGVYLPNKGYVSNYRYEYNSTTSRYDKIQTNEFKQAIESPDAKLAYSSNTREYLRRRIWRTLKQLGEESDLDYIKIGVELLLQYSDVDAVAVKESVLYRWNRSNWTRIEYHRHWDAYAGYLTFNHILYENSSRYVLLPNSNGWRCREGYKAGDPEPEMREEAFPQLWENHPDALLRLLLESNCYPVHSFAVKAIQKCPQFCQEIDINTIIKLVNKPYLVTTQLGFQLAREKYNPDNPNLELVQALVHCSLESARRQVYQWIELNHDRFLESTDFIISLITSQHSDTRLFTRRILTSAILNEAHSKVIIGRLIAELLSFDVTQAEIAKEVAETLLLCFTPQLRQLGFGVILDLLAYPLPEIQEFGANILLNHQTPAANLPPKLIQSLINSPHASIRVIGVKIFGQLPDEILLSSRDLLLTMVTHKQIEIRQVIRPIILRLSQTNLEFSDQLKTELIEILIKQEKTEGLHRYLVSLIREDFPNWLSNSDKDTALRLLKAKSSSSQELGGLILNINSINWASQFETYEIVQLGSHEILLVRQAAWVMFEEILNRIHNNPQEMLAAVRLLEAEWDDSREFAWRTFSSHFSEQDWTPEVMVSICDSNREDVRQFGRDLVTGYFQSSYGQDYLLKFSEHPSRDMQLFATNYLENYAVDNPNRLSELVPYFITVLSQINRGRLAKNRVFAFLETEAKKSQLAAQIVAEILTRHSLTVAIGDKATAIQIMLKIHQQYPQIYLPIQVKTPRAISNRQ